jgi:uncharacterized protein YndB with AHSA1/START domain
MTERARTDELVLRETFRAARERIFSRMTDAAELVKWWGPAGFSTPQAAIDLTVGGGYRLTMQPPHGAPFHLAGAFLEVDRPNRLSYTFRWEEPLPDDRETIVVLVLQPVDGGTEVLLSHSGFATEERLRLHRDGWTQAFEKLRTLVERTDPTDRRTNRSVSEG